METTVLTCTAREGMYDTKDAGRNVRSEVHTLMGRIRSILGYRKDTMAHLTKQFTLFQTVTNRGTRSHSHTNHQQYVKASVDDFLTITFLLRAESEFQVSLASLHTLEYIKGDWFKIWVHWLSSMVNYSTFRSSLTTPEIVLVFLTMVLDGSSINWTSI